MNCISAAWSNGRLHDHELVDDFGYPVGLLRFGRNRHLCDGITRSYGVKKDREQRVEENRFSFH
jgi:hypothetical protein